MSVKTYLYNIFKCFNISLLITLAVVLCNSSLKTKEDFPHLSDKDLARTTVAAELDALTFYPDQALIVRTGEIPKPDIVNIGIGKEEHLISDSAKRFSYIYEFPAKMAGLNK
jgi:hypothetical protein